MTLRIAINGLGRIGRCLIRALRECEKHSQLELVAVNGPASIEEHVHLLTYDSVHGTFPYQVKGEQGMLSIEGLPPIQVFHSRNPSELPWKSLDIDIVLECTGKFTKRDDAAQHLRAGAKKVIVSAPCDQADATIVFGVNHTILQPAHEVISVGSCTTNCLAPIAKILHETVGIQEGFMTTIHSYTNDQNVLDGSHKDKRRARACAVSMVPTSTGAAKAIGLVLPELAGKLAGSAVRVPTPNVSMIDLTFKAAKKTSKTDINEALKRAANGALKGVLGYCESPLVSIDFNHNPHSSIVDSLETFVVNDTLCRVVSWYDNEWGFSVRMLDVAQLFGTILR